MNLPVIPAASFPSRAASTHVARVAVRSGRPVFVTGELGCGRTSFATRLLGAGTTYRVTGAPALRSVPFATIAALSAQLPGADFHQTSPSQLVAAIARTAAATVLLDNADEIDPESAASFAQLSENGALGIVCVSRSLASLPAPLRRLAQGPTAHHVELGALTAADAAEFLGDLLGGAVNVSTAGLLRDAAGGNPLHLRELALDARSEQALTEIQGYWTLRAGWAPRGARVADLITARLAHAPDELREAIELLAITGELPLRFAAVLVGDDLIDLGADEGLLEISADAESGFQVALGAALTPETVLATLGRRTLRAHSAHIRERLPREQMNPHTRVMLAVHSQALNAVMTPEELFEDAAMAAHARQFAAVLVLTEPESGIAASGRGDEVALLRAQALHEMGRQTDALEVVADLLERADPRARTLAAWIDFHGLGDPDGALRRLEPLPGDPREIGAYANLLALISNRVTDLDRVEADAEAPEISRDLRVQLHSQALIERCFRGTPVQVLTRCAQLFDDPLWLEASPSARGELLHAVHTATLTAGFLESRLAELSGRINWDEFAVDHAAFLGSRITVSYDHGDAAATIALADQIFALLAEADPYHLQGFVAGYAASAAALLGDTESVRRYVEIRDASPDTSGYSLRPEADRVTILALVHLHGPDVARAELERQLSSAQERNRVLLELRLRHDAWRWGLIDDVTTLSAVAAKCEGVYAATLSRYASALATPGDLIDTLVDEHLHEGRVLFAAELAQRGSQRARSTGDRSLASRLLARSAEIARDLSGVNTPALGRTRIDAGLLTERELAICTRAADGATNAEIAEELFLSPRTVEGHLQRAYVKLGIGDRRQLLPARI